MVFQHTRYLVGRREILTLGEGFNTLVIRNYPMPISWCFNIVAGLCASGMKNPKQAVLMYIKICSLCHVPTSATHHPHAVRTSAPPYNNHSTPCNTRPGGPASAAGRARYIGSCDAPRATQAAVWPLLSELVSAPGRGPSPKYEEYAPRSTARSRRDMAMSSSGVPY